MNLYPFSALSVILSKFFNPHHYSMKTNQNIIAVIPARYGSTCFPGKSLALIQTSP
jgi:hypothetical protein